MLKRRGGIFIRFEMISYWEQDLYTHADFCIIGAGIIGLSAAISIKRKHPKALVRILERGTFPTGASTRNAGFACFGSFTEIVSDLKHWGESKTYEIVEKRKMGLEMLRRRLGDDECGEYEEFGGYELITEEQEPLLESLNAVNRMLQPIFHGKTFVDHSSSISTFGFGDKVKHMLYCPFEAQIHSGKTMRALERYARSHGIEILHGVDVKEIVDAGSHSELISYVAPFNVKHVFKTRYIVVCTNARIPDLVPDLQIVPGRGQVLVTSPIENLSFRGIFHYDEGYYYFRNLGKRVLLGGGRNLDFEEEQTYDFSTSDKIQDALMKLLKEIVLPSNDFTIERKWAGTMGFSSTKLPIVKRINEKLAVGFGCNGMGVALGSIIGEEVAALFN